MKKSFAEKVIDSMVDENGNCGTRVLSQKQFDVLSQNLALTDTIDRGGWKGDFKYINFTEDIWRGAIGPYKVVLSCFHHFRNRCTVVEIKKWIEVLPDFTFSNFVGEVGQRLELPVTMAGISHYQSENKFSGFQTVNVYKLMDADENLLVWKTTASLGVYEDDTRWHLLQPGDSFTLRGTVKAHNVFNDVMQTVLSRCTVVDYQEDMA